MATAATPREAGGWSRAATVLLTAAAGVAFTWGVIAVWPFTVDDAYIVLRYAANLAAGHGPTFNVGEPPVEGVTQFSWLLLLAVPHWIGCDGATFAKALGVLAMIGAGHQVAALAAGLGRAGAVPPALVGAIAVACFAVLPMTAVHAVAGLETALFTWLLVALVRAVATRRDGECPDGWRLGGLALCLGLTRAEGNLAALVVLALACWFAAAGERRRLVRRIAGVYVLPGAAYFAWRWSYYGLPLPLPFYVKIHAPGSFQADAQTGVQMAGELARHLGAPWLVAMLLGAVTAGRRAWPLIATGVALAALAACTPDIMGYEWRFFFPVVALALPLVAVGVAAIGRGIAAVAGPRRAPPAAHVVAAGLGAALAIPFAVAAPARVAPWVAYADGLANAHRALGAEMATLRGLAPDPVVMIADAGVVPYVSGWRARDSFGLNDATIATTGRHDAAELLAAAPDVLVLISRSGEQFTAELPWEEDVFALARRRGHEIAQRLRFSPTYFLWVLCPIGSPHLAPLRDWRPAAGVTGAVVQSNAPSTDGCVRHAIDAHYASGLVVESVRVRADLLVVDLRCERPQRGRAKLFVHVHPSADPAAPLLRQHDFEPSPTCDRMRVGRTYACWRALDPPLEPGAVLRIGVFDESDPTLAPWPDRAGRSVLEVRVQ